MRRFFALNRTLSATGGRSLATISTGIEGILRGRSPDHDLLTASDQPDARRVG